MKIVFATNNLNKLSEIRDLLSNSIEILSLSDINCYAELPETHHTLHANAMQKAQYVATNYNINCFADDTGLEIDALGGNPGVHSARYAGEDCIAKNNISRVLSELEMQKNRSANFRTVIALILDGKEHFFEGQCSGLITNSELGDKGFGYDPIFMPNGYNKTFAQMSKAEKGFISHRGKAVAKLARFLSLIAIS